MRPRVHAGAALVGILALGTLIAFLPRKPSRLELGAALALGTALAAWAALRGPFARRRAAFAAALALAVLAPAAGWVSWHSRSYLERGLFRWDAIRLDLPELAPVKSALSRSDEEAAQAALLAHFAARPSRDLNTLPPLTEAEATRQSDLVLQGMFQFFDEKTVQLPLDLSWDEDPLGSRTWQWMLHTMDFVLPLVERHRLTGDPRWLQRAEDLVLDWLRDNHLYFTSPPNRYAWHDHVTALRARAWLVFWEPWVRSGLASPAEARDVLGAIRAHAEKLADPAFYTEGHNHGLEQDLALVAIGVAFPELELSDGWIRTGCARLEKQVAETVSPDGVHLEHSANYHFMVLGILARALDFARRHSLALDRDRLQRTVDGMARYGAYLLQPDGRVPLLGDTSAQKPLDLADPMLSTCAARDPVLLHALSRGREGAPGELSVVHPEEGYAIFRDSWMPHPDFGKAVHLIFAAAAHEGRAHKQADDLTILLYGRGRELVVGPGLFSYSAEDAGRRHILGAASHNTVLIDGKSFQGYATRIERFAMDPSWGLVEASHDNYPGVRHRRLLLYVRPATILVVDELIPRDPGATREIEQLFHLDPAMEAAVLPGSSAVAARYRDGPSLRIEQLAEGRGHVAVLRGSTTPYRGWVSRLPRNLEPAPVVVTKMAAGRATLATWIEVDPEAPPGNGAGAASGGAEVSIDGDRIAFRWPAGGRIRTAIVKRTGELALTLSP